MAEPELNAISVVVPVYRNEESLPHVVDHLRQLVKRTQELHGVGLEAVFVVDGSPDASHTVLTRLLADVPFSAQLVLHSRNFGSFAAVRTGLSAARGRWFAVMAADLQEPPELIVDFLSRLVDDSHDVVVGRRVGREDRAGSQFAANAFWRLYRGLINREIPAGGVDVFACNDRFRRRLLTLRESNSSLVALIYWLGYRRTEVPYERLERPYGSSAWTLRKKVRYMMDSVFAFTSLPISLLMGIGLVGSATAGLLGMITLVARVFGWIAVPGYAGVLLAVIFFGALNLLGLGVVGSYAWRTFENSKQRPLSVVQSALRYPDPIEPGEPVAAVGPGAPAGSVSVDVTRAEKKLDLDRVTPAGDHERKALAE